MLVTVIQHQSTVYNESALHMYGMVHQAMCSPCLDPTETQCQLLPTGHPSFDSSCQVAGLHGIIVVCAQQRQGVIG